MKWIVIYMTALLAVSLHAGWRGGAPERWVAAIFVAASTASLFPRQPIDPYVHVFWTIALIDTITFAAIATIALTADRFWPLAIAALQLVTVALHGVRAYNAAILPLAYWLVIGKISYLMLIILVIGTSRHDDRRSRKFVDYGWTWRRHADSGRGSR